MVGNPRLGDRHAIFSGTGLLKTSSAVPMPPSSPTIARTPPPDRATIAEPCQSACTYPNVPSAGLPNSGASPDEVTFHVEPPSGERKPQRLAAVGTGLGLGGATAA